MSVLDLLGGIGARPGLKGVPGLFALMQGITEREQADCLPVSRQAGLVEAGLQGGQFIITQPSR